MVTRKAVEAAILGVGGLAAVAGIGALVRRNRHANSFVRAADSRPDELLHRPTHVPRTVPVVTDDGAQLHVQIYGDPDAQPIVFSHGWTCSVDYWTPQINAFADNYKVIVYDQRGHGRSDVGTRPLGPDVLADDLADVLAATVDESDKAVLVGHSMGGMSVMAWAGRYPEQVDRLVSAVLLASTATDSLVRETTVIPLPQRFPRVPVPVGRVVLKSAVPLRPSSVTRHAIKYVSMAPGSTPAEVAFCEKIVLECAPRTRGIWGAALTDLDIHEALKNLNVPTTVLVGTADRLTPPVHARKLAEALEAHDHLSALVEIPGIGHMSSVEAIDEFNAEVARLRNL
ncbi:MULTISPECIES: alpha/beta fold hydrolase [Nocardiaceae]|uniref:alpha/beta fold hydrolase n=1 Tax=Nocardiaceae TaxID=85025 RepID=UPI00055ED6F1|nr:MULTISPECIES: alpha/beta hydrolase [Rhodococcus]OZE99521.1 alpha/beta hydrolase [Rhodococcus sp. 15-1189-1-1a]OZF13809.1 alpha/beta hydrolase [Rhodococcus sp. 14-2686-1-2]OZF50946.1 alpha/beta hydrolase [Rhodococcus sp. 14-2470-1b]